MEGTGGGVRGGERGGEQVAGLGGGYYKCKKHYIYREFLSRLKEIICMYRYSQTTEYTYRTLSTYIFVFVHFETNLLFSVVSKYIFGLFQLILK